MITWKTKPDGSEVATAGKSHLMVKRAAHERGGVHWCGRINRALVTHGHKTASEAKTVVLYVLRFRLQAELERIDEQLKGRTAA